MLYFDHCASTPPHEEVIRTLADVMKLHYANPSSIHRAGAEAAKLMERSRVLAAGLFGTKPKEWVFTSGGTESNNLAVKGAARAFRSRGNHLVTSQIEHPSVYEAFRSLEREGFRVTYIPVSETGHIDVRDVQAALTDDTILVSIMHVNNETGAIQPVEAIGRLLKGRPKTLFHVDGVQSTGKLAVEPVDWGIDLFTVSAHKLRGPKGAGWLYVRDGVGLEALLHGGDQEGGLRAGTENVPAIVASAKALRLAIESQPERESRMYALRARLLRGIDGIAELVPSGPAAEADEGGRGTVDAPMAPHIVHFCYPGMKPEVAIHLLEKHGVVASTKSACSSRQDNPSRVLLAMGREGACAAGGIRLSLGDEHDDRAIDLLTERLATVVRKLKPLEKRGAERDV
ncbi:cysteine desulfurase family protein [uncultured Paenibacillus sp.]|uniref:cysteine desulfurase family protein n=1 Tax=uncultured Paenibacillus sp. TaxID=227322 RepID=UPI0028D691DA|nr:cysteine desulfurase family protein [uncultured Paenibacillus sp.]